MCPTSTHTVPSHANGNFLSARAASHGLYRRMTEIHIITSKWPIMLFPWRLSKVRTRSRIQSVRQMTIIHSDIGHCWLAVIVLYLLHLSFNILYIAPVFYDGEDRRTITERGRYFSPGSLAPIPFFFTFWVFFRGNWNISSWRNRCNKKRDCCRVSSKCGPDWNPGDTRGTGRQGHFWTIAVGGKFHPEREIRLKIILPLEGFQVKLIFTWAEFCMKTGLIVSGCVGECFHNNNKLPVSFPKHMMPLRKWLYYSEIRSKLEKEELYVVCMTSYCEGGLGIVP